MSYHYRLEMAKKCYVRSLTRRWLNRLPPRFERLWGCCLYCSIFDVDTCCVLSSAYLFNVVDLPGISFELYIYILLRYSLTFAFCIIFCIQLVGSPSLYLHAEETTTTSTPTIQRTKHTTCSTTINSSSSIRPRGGISRPTSKINVSLILGREVVKTTTSNTPITTKTIITISFLLLLVLVVADPRPNPNNRAISGSRTPPTFPVNTHG